MVIKQSSIKVLNNVFSYLDWCPDGYNQYCAEIEKNDLETLIYLFLGKQLFRKTVYCNFIADIMSHGNLTATLLFIGDNEGEFRLAIPANDLF